MKMNGRGLAALAALALWAGAASAQAPAPDPRQQAFEESRKVAVSGPADVPLAGKATLKLPEGHAFVPQPQAGKLLNAMGNPGQDPRLQGLIFPKGDAGWFMTVRYEDSGHVKDDDAKDWNADDLLKSYREGTEASNEERVKMGVPAMEIVGWAEKPAYDAGTHRLVWAMSSRDKGAPATEEQGVNYNTYVLGREGYFMLNLVTGLKELPAHKPAAHTMLSALNFNEGQRYADFNGSTDRVAEYGLAALVVGAAAKKLGFLAAAGLFFAKFAKVILLAVAGVGGLAMKLFKRKGAGTRSHPRPERGCVSKLLLVLLSGAKLGKLFTTGGTMLVSLVVYAFVFGWKYAAGFVALLFVHEMGHYIAAKQRGLAVGAPTFIPFVGAWIEMKDLPHDAETEAHVGLGGPLLGSVGALAVYFMAQGTGAPTWLLAVAYAGFFLNLFNLIPLSPFDGGRITAVLSPRIWLLGVPVLVALFFWRPSPMLILMALLAAPQVWKAWRFDPNSEEARTYYAVPAAKKWEYGLMYLGLVAFLAVMAHDTHELLETARQIRGG